MQNMLEILRRRIHEVNAAPDLQHALDVIVTRLKQDMSVDASSVYLVTPGGGELVLMATDGLNKSAVGKVRLKEGAGLVGLVRERAEPVNLEDGLTHPRYLSFSHTGETVMHGFLGVPIIQHRQVLGVLVVRQRAYRRFGENEVTFLVTLAAQLAGPISHAKATGGVAQMLQEVGGASFMLKGLPGAPGVAVGQATVVYPPARLELIPDRRSTDVAREEEIFRAAVRAVQDDIRNFSRHMTGVLPEEDLALFNVYVMMLDSDSLVERTLEHIRAGNWAPGALRATIAEHVRVFEEMEDAYLSERASDIRDLGRRILVRLQATETVTPVLRNRTILVGDEVSAVHLAEIPTEALAAVVSARGSASSHVAILANALGIPAVMGLEDLPSSYLEGQELIVNGYRGHVYVRPNASVRAEFKRLEAEEAELTSGLAELVPLKAETPDGIHMPLYVNTGLLADISPSLRSGADGIGLYRTEIPFMVRNGFPTEEEQVRIYQQVLESFAPAPVIIRTLDVGGDKALPYFPVEEDNPFLGWRGIRLMLDHPEIFLTQLRAILRANAGLNNLQLMLPMISHVRQVDDALKLVGRARDELLEDGFDIVKPPLGVMIEVPSAVYQMDALAERVDFFSVGTNDLTQYLLAVDRNNARVAELYQTLHPAVLHALKQIVDSAHAHGIPVSVCGEMAGDPAAAILLLGLGVDSLSMTVGSLSRVKWVLRSISSEVAKGLTNTALALEDADAIRNLLVSVLEDTGLGGLVRAGK